MGSIWALRNWRCDRALLQNLNRRAYNLGFHPVICVSSERRLDISQTAPSRRPEGTQIGGFGTMCWQAVTASLIRQSVEYS